MTEPTVLDTARAWLAAGVSVIPARADGTKAPAGAWKAWTHVRPKPAQVDAWFGDGHPGIGLVCGAVSGGLEMLELEGRAVDAGAVEALGACVEAAGLGQLWRRLVDGYAEATPSGGLHLLYRVAGAPVPGNTKLARRPATAEELTAAPGDRIKVLAETRGEGGFVVVAPSHGPVHPTGEPWVILAGAPGTVPTITAAERTELHRVVRAALDQMTIMDAARERVPGEVITGTGPDQPGRDLAGAPAGPTSVRIGPAPVPFAAPARPAPPAGYESPGDAYERATDWASILEPAGWTRVSGRPGAYSTWRRPGKREGISATTGGATDRDRLYVFSTSTEFDSEVPYTKFGAYAVLHHHGDHGAAAAELTGRGYGTLPQVSTPALNEWLAAPTPDAWAVAVDAEVAKLRLRAEARERHEAERHAKLWTPPTDHGPLSVELDIPDEAVQWRLKGLLGVGHNAVLVASRKAGKTTMVGNLVRSYVDGEPFLGRFEVERTDAPVAIFNYEVDERQYRRWLRETAIIGLDRVHVLHLRGRVLPLKDARVRAWVIGWLRARNIGLWIVDPYSRAYTGSLDNGNDEAQVNAFLDTLDIIKAESGVSELVMPVHTPKARAESGEESAIGSQRLEGWPDSMWYLTKDLETGLRFLRAEGRDVDVAEEQLTYDPTARRLTMGGWDRVRARQHADTERILACLTAHPGISQNALGDKLGWTSRKTKEAVAKAGRDVRTEAGERGASLHYALLSTAVQCCCNSCSTTTAAPSKGSSGAAVIEQMTFGAPA